jgi:hypothetical protein
VKTTGTILNDKVAKDDLFSGIMITYLSLVKQNSSVTAKAFIDEKILRSFI